MATVTVLLSAFYRFSAFLLCAHFHLDNFFLPILLILLLFLQLFFVFLFIFIFFCLCVSIIRYSVLIQRALISGSLPVISIKWWFGRDLNIQICICVCVYVLMIYVCVFANIFRYEEIRKSCRVRGLWCLANSDCTMTCGARNIYFIYTIHT